MERADFVVIGLGAAGAATCHELARRGAAVIGIDRYAPPHALGSSHGRTRIIREAYFEHPLYVPLVQRAYELWSELEELTGTVLYRQTGGLMIGPPDGVLVSGSALSARTHELPFEVLDASTVRRRFPGLQPDDSWSAVFEPRAGMLLPEHCIRTMLRLAQGYGARLRTGTSVNAWHVDAAGDVVIHTSAGEIRAGHAVFAAGPWINPLLASERASSSASFQLPLTVQRQVSWWFRPSPGVHAFRHDACPVTIWEHQPNRFFYTLPDVGDGVKAGIHFEGADVQPDSVDRTVHEDDEVRMRSLMDMWMPGSAHSVADAVVCLYTMTPDGHFVIDRHPAHEQVLLLSPCSGHGFKFAPAIGEVAADLLLEGVSGFDLAPFSAARF